MPLVVQDLSTVPEHLRLPQVLRGVRVTRYLVLCLYLVDRCLSFCPYLLAIVLSIILRFTDSDYPFAGADPGGSHEIPQQILRLPPQLEKI